MSKDYKTESTKHLWVVGNMADFEEKPPKVIVKGKGAVVTDIDGKDYIDGRSSLWNVNIGYSREEIAEAVAQQIKELSYYCIFGYANKPAVDLADKLVEIAPEGLNHVYLSCGGAEAIETAIKMARHYARKKYNMNKYKIISLKRAYHGISFGAYSATGAGGGGGTKGWYEPLVPGFHHIDSPDRFRCEYCKNNSECTLQCAESLQREIEFQGKNTVAAFVAEPIRITNGISPKTYLERIMEICKENDVLYIADEVICGFGRTGKMFAMNHWDATPDIMVVAKGITSGYLPLAATLTKDDIYETIKGEKGNRESGFTGGFTYSGHPVVCAAALANIDIIQKENLVENSRIRGEQLLEGLKNLETKYPIVGEVGGIGLLARMELVKDRGTKEAFPREAGVGDKITERLDEKGVLLRSFGETVSLSPPLVITKEQIDKIVDALDYALSTIMEELPALTEKKS
ncbi:MAG: aspartate aminotransferase family protein [Candidatus Tectomicrobia bacterium]|nr:aspartate aminotransferase family protein [Candidatus Tectomicrobia bacterium]